MNNIRKGRSDCQSHMDCRYYLTNELSHPLALGSRITTYMSETSDEVTMGITSTRAKHEYGSQG